MEINYYPKCMEILFGDPLPPPVIISYAILIQRLKQMLPGAILILQYTCLIQFEFKIDENPVWRPPPPQVLVSY
jgi:hypothetical protein